MKNKKSRYRHTKKTKHYELTMNSEIGLKTNPNYDEEGANVNDEREVEFQEGPRGGRR